jgi:hypothetical protein
MFRELDVSDAVDGIDLAVEILHGFDGVGIWNLGCCVNPQAACGANSIHCGWLVVAARGAEEAIKRGRGRTPSKAIKGGPVIGEGQERPSTRLIPCTSSDTHGWCIVRQGFEYWWSPLLLSRRRMLPADRSGGRRRNWWWSDEEDLVVVTDKRRHGLSLFSLYWSAWKPTVHSLLYIQEEVRPTYCSSS